MVTNALSPVRVLDALHDLVPETGTLGVMSSTQGSIARNVNGGHEVYRASKSALNQLVRSVPAATPTTRAPCCWSTRAGCRPSSAGTGRR